MGVGVLQVTHERRQNAPTAIEPNNHKRTERLSATAHIERDLATNNTACGRGQRLRVCGGVGSGGASGVDEELALVLKGLVLVGVSRDQDVAVQLALHHGQALAVTPGHNLMSMAQTNLEAANVDHLGLRKLRVLGGGGGGEKRIRENKEDPFDTHTKEDTSYTHIYTSHMNTHTHTQENSKNVGTHLIKVPLDHVHVTRNGLQVIRSLLAAKVSSAQDVLNLAGDLHVCHGTQACTHKTHIEEGGGHEPRNVFRSGGGRGRGGPGRHASMQ